MNIYIPKKNRSIIKHKSVSFSKPRVSFNLGFFAIESLQFGMVTPRQLEAGRKFIVRNLTRKSKMWRLVTVTQPVTRKSKLSRMGKGKGKFLGWLGYVKPGTFIYEMGNLIKEKSVDVAAISEKFKKVSSKFSFKIKLRERSYLLDKNSPQRHWLTLKKR